MLEIASACLVLTALLAYLNHRFIGLPTTIGVMAGRVLGARFGKYAEGFGGIVLIVIGGTILAQHLSA